MYIQFFPTLRCNSSCSFCFNRGLSAASDIKIEEFKKLADLLSAEGVAEIDLLGGEPTLHPEFSSLIESAVSKGFYLSMSSNGSDARILEETARRFDRDSLMIGISLNGDINKRLLSFISNYKPVLKSVCNSRSFFPGTADKFLGKYIIRYYAIFMDALKISDLKESMSFPEFYRKLIGHRKRFDNLDGVYCQGFISDDDSAALNNVRCPAGTAKLSIMPDGSVYPCYLFFRNPEYRLGNIFVDPFKKIMQNPALDFFRNFEKNNCPIKDCEFHGRCHGGCPGVSLAVRGDISAPDPRCVIPQ